MKKHCTRSICRLPSIVKIALLVTPSTAFAMGGEWLAEGILILVLLSVVWLIASAASFIPKTKPWTVNRYALWAIRLSFPVWVAWSIIDLKYIDPYFGRLRHERKELLQDRAQHEFSSLCKQHASQATKVFQVVDSNIPKNFLFEEIVSADAPWPPLSSSLFLNNHFNKCIAKQLTSACSQLELESTEWALIHPKDRMGCPNGNVPGTDRCLPNSYYRYEFVESTIKSSAVSQPISDYVIRIEEVKNAVKNSKVVQKHQITLETRIARQPLAKINIFTSRIISQTCPNPENEVAQMLLRVFPQK